MPVAADIDEALDLVVENVTLKAATLVADMATWLVVFTQGIAGPGAAFDPQSADQRTVRDWYGPSLRARTMIDLTDVGSTQLSVSEIIAIVARTLFATKFALINSRITADQETSVVNQYNLAWA